MSLQLRRPVVDSAELRKMAADLRAIAARNDSDRREKAAQVLDAAVAIHRLRQKVRTHG